MKAISSMTVLVTLAAVPAAWAAPIQSGDVVVYRVGDGSATLSNASAATFLDEYTPAGTLVQSITLGDANQAFSASGSASSEGLINYSNGYLAFTGYDAAAGTAGIANTTSAATPRTVGVVTAGTGAISYTNLTDLSTGNNVRSAFTSDGTNLYATGGAGGLRYATAGSTTSTQLSTTTANLRDVVAVGGQLYVTSSSGSTRIATVGTGVPATSGQTITNLPGISSTNSPSPYQVFFADLSTSVAGVDTLYVADSTNGIQKFGFDGTTWTLEGAVADANVTGLTGTVVGGTVTLFASTPTTLASLTDGTGSTGTLAGTLATVATAGTNTAFRGAAFVAAVPEPATFAAVGLAGVLGLRRRRA